MGGVVFGDDEQAAGVLVDAVDDAGADGPADAGKRGAAVVEQRIDQRAVRVAGGRMHDHPLGFVDDEQVFVLIDDVERDILRLRFDRLRVGQRQRDGVAGGDLVFFVGRRAVAQHLPLFNQRLQRAAGKLPRLRGQPAVQPLARIGRGGRELKRLHGAAPP